MDKNNTGFAAEFIVIAELARRDFNVAITFGNTKKIDIIIDKNGVSKQIQVKGLKHRKDYNFRLKVDSLAENCWYVFVNVNRLNLGLNYEFAIMNYNEVIDNLRRHRNQNDNAIRVSVLDNPVFKNNWNRFDQ